MTFPTEWKNNPTVPNHQPELYWKLHKLWDGIGWHSKLPDLLETLWLSVGWNQTNPYVNRAETHWTPFLLTPPKSVNHPSHHNETKESDNAVHRGTSTWRAISRTSNILYKYIYINRTENCGYLQIAISVRKMKKNKHQRCIPPSQTYGSESWGTMGYPCSKTYIFMDVPFWLKIGYTPKWLFFRREYHGEHWWTLVNPWTQWGAIEFQTNPNGNESRSLRYHSIWLS
jgi:hypothetical protein